ncbi:hypothetical protein MSG28_014284 [Choristoneura fumiferana]|uniref:Uncharacterized protein n=1 Tax=Choristoneura fumiferana TaxID=7141 RepID=A0ACC0JGP2_CHOFU|nr:hypothetical protein MSG28_014284 [Choristoneura fumiferana]
MSMGKSYLLKIISCDELHARIKMDNEQPHQELVKCVVVGDTAVGKTRLICARACNKHVSLAQLMTTHVPTVWAIDQYRIYKDVSGLDSWVGQHMGNSVESTSPIPQSEDEDQRVLPFMTYCTETCTLTVGLVHRFKSLSEQWKGLCSDRRIDNRWGKRVPEWIPRIGKRGVGRPQTRWSDDLRKVAGKNWMRVAEDRAVLERSWEVVDGVNVSLRLWDTFGDHEKDRRFAYGRSDVVLLCFSVTNPISLRNCGAMWYPEIRRFCPNTPILLVGCKNDLRYMYRDETYLSYCKDRSPFIRTPRKSDLVMPDQGRALAAEFGIYYYETSVFTYYGINEVFRERDPSGPDSPAAAAVWMTNLKRGATTFSTGKAPFRPPRPLEPDVVPVNSSPFRPPRPLEPDVVPVNSSYLENTTTLLRQQYFSDMVIICGAKGFPVHRFMMAAACEAFNRLLASDCARGAELARSSSESSMVSSMGEATTGDFNEDTEYLIRQDQAKQMR